jgi:predicted small secreted protein
MGTPLRLAAILFAVVTASACNTVAGLGKDVERGGEKLQDTARDVQKKN